MVAEPITYVDVEGAVRAWAREAVPAALGRVFFQPGKPFRTPQIVMFRVAGPDDACLIQFDVYAASKGGAVALAADLASAAVALGRYTFVADEHEGAAVLLHGARVLGVSWQPDMEGGTPRYIVEAIFTATAG